MVPRAGKGSALSFLTVGQAVLLFAPHNMTGPVILDVLVLGKDAVEWMRRKFQWENHKEKSNSSGARQNIFSKKKNHALLKNDSSQAIWAPIQILGV